MNDLLISESVMQILSGVAIYICWKYFEKKTTKHWNICLVVSFFRLTCSIKAKGWYAFSLLTRREKNRHLRSERAKCAAELTYAYGTVHRVGTQTARVSPKMARTVLIQTGEFHSRTVRPSHKTLTSTNQIYFRTLPNGVAQRAFDKEINDLWNDKSTK